MKKITEKFKLYFVDDYYLNIYVKTIDEALQNK